MEFNNKSYDDKREEEKLMGYLFLLNNSSTDSIEELNYINAYISELLKIKFDVSTNAILTLEDKGILENYFKNFYQKSLENYSELNLGYINKVLDYMVKFANYGLFYEEDNVFVLELYGHRLINDLKFLLQKEDVEKEFILTLLIKCTTNQIDLVEQYLKSKEEIGEDIYKSKIMQTYIEEFIMHTAYGYIEEQRNFEFFKKYIDEITKRPDFNIFNEQNVIDTLQLIYSHRISDERAKEIQDILEKNLHISQIDAKAEQDELIQIINSTQNKVITDEDKMDEFAKHLSNLKLANYRILNQSLIDFVLMQCAFKDSAISKNPEKYKGLIEGCLKELGRNDLPAKINPNNYVYFIRDTFSRGNLFGKYIIDFNIIYLRQSIVNNLLYKKSNPCEAIETIYHENTHASQTYDIENSTYNDYYRYLMTKEQIIEKYNPMFYSTNYEMMFKEIDARISESRKMFKALKRVGLIDTTQLSVNDLGNPILSPFYEPLINEYKNLRSGKLKKLSYKSDETFKVEDLFDSIILEHPEFIESYPKLKAEYNEDGTLKRIDQILPDIDLAKEAGSRQFYLKMLRNGNCFKPENLPEDLNSIMSYEIQNSKSVYIVALIISQNIPRMIDRIQEIPNERLVDLYYEINNLQKRIEEIKAKPREELTYTETAVLMGMTKVNRDYSKDTLSMLYEARAKIESLGIDLIPVSNEKHTGGANESTGTAARKGVTVLAEAYYSTGEDNRTKLMSDIIDLESQNQQNSGERSPSQEKDENSRS